MVASFKFASGVDIVAVDVVWAAAEVVVGAADVVSAVDVAAAVDVGVADEAGEDVEGVEESVGAGEGEEAEEILVLEADAGEYKGLETTRAVPSESTYPTNQCPDA